MKIKYISLQFVAVMVLRLAVIEALPNLQTQPDGRKTSDCVFPFKYKNDWYHGCTTKDAGRAWCSKLNSTDSNLVGGHYWAWGWCRDIASIATFSGTTSIGECRKSSKTIEVSFGQVLPSIPIVEARTESHAFHPDRFQTTISRISTVGFVVIILRTDSSHGWGQNPTLHWTVKDAVKPKRNNDHLSNFKKYPEKDLMATTTDNGWRYMTPYLCARKCIKQGEFRCASFNYNKAIQGCDLFPATKDTLEISPAVVDHRDVDYYELLPLENYLLSFKRYRGTKLITTDIERGWRGMTPDICAKKCKKEKRFRCTSFNYNKATEECDLYSLTIATLEITPAVVAHRSFDYYELLDLVTVTFTYTDHQCHFPFTYKGDTFYGCTTLDHPRDKSWCLIKDEATNTQGKYQDLCINEHNQAMSTFGRESTGAQCHFPFTYNGVTYHGCTNDNRPGLYDRRSDGRYWCGLTSAVPDQRDAQWGYCNAIDTVQHFARLVWNTNKPWKPTTCVFPFTYRGAQYYGCQSYKDSKRRLWCSTTDNYDKDEKWKYCDDADVIAVADYVRPQDQLSRSKPQCSFPYVRKGRMQIGDWDYQRPECSTTHSYDTDQKSQVSGRRPNVPLQDNQCNYPFLYKGTIYHTCVHGISSYWCSRDKVYDGDWITCDPNRIANTLAVMLPSNSQE